MAVKVVDVDSITASATTLPFLVAFAYAFLPSSQESKVVKEIDVSESVALGTFKCSASREKRKKRPCRAIKLAIGSPRRWTSSRRTREWFAVVIRFYASDTMCGGTSSIKHVSLTVIDGTVKSSVGPAKLTKQIPLFSDIEVCCKNVKANGKKIKLLQITAPTCCWTRFINQSRWSWRWTFFAMWVLFSFQFLVSAIVQIYIIDSVSGFGRSNNSRLNLRR